MSEFDKPSDLLNRMRQMRTASSDAVTSDVFPRPDPSRWKRNLRALDQRDPALAALLRKRPESDARVPVSASMPSSSLPRTDIESILLCMGAVQMARFLLDRPALANFRLVVIAEHDPQMLCWFLRRYDLSASLRDGISALVLEGQGDQNLSLFVRNAAIQWAAVLALAQSVQILGSDTQIGYAEPFYRRMAAEIKLGFDEARMYYGNDPHDSLIGIENMFENLDIILENPGILQLEKAFPGMPAVVVATGPSLNDALPALARIAHEGKALIFACDYSVKHLVEAGIHFHFVVSLERNPYVAKFFREYDLPQSWLFSPPLQSRHILESYRGPRVVVYRNVKHFDWLEVPKGTLDIKSSVANMAWSIAEWMGCAPIVLAGQDLCYGADGSTHARGSLMGDRQDAVVRQGQIRAPGNLGTEVLTNRIWLSCAKSYEIDIARSGVPTIHATPGALRIEGVQVMEMDAAEQALPESSMRPDQIAARLADLLQPPDSKTQHHQLQRICRNIDQSVDECQAILEALEESDPALRDFLAGPVREIALGHRDHIDPEMVERMYQESIRLKQLPVERGGRAWECLVLHVAQSVIIDHMIDDKRCFMKYADPDMARINIVARHMQWVEQMRQHTTTVMRMLERARQRTADLTAR